LSAEVNFRPREIPEKRALSEKHASRTRGPMSKRKESREKVKVKVEVKRLEVRGKENVK
jgi:hypothetical protein